MNESINQSKLIFKQVACIDQSRSSAPGLLHSKLTARVRLCSAGIRGLLGCPVGPGRRKEVWVMKATRATGLGSRWKFTIFFLFLNHHLCTRHCINAADLEIRHDLSLEERVHSSHWADRLVGAAGRCRGRYAPTVVGFGQKTSHGSGTGPILNTPEASGCPSKHIGDVFLAQDCSINSCLSFQPSCLPCRAQTGQSPQSHEPVPSDRDR